MRLKYIGNGLFLPGIPARDLSAQEVGKFGEQKLIDSKLYIRAAQPNRKKEKLQ